MGQYLPVVALLVLAVLFGACALFVDNFLSQTNLRGLALSADSSTAYVLTGDGVFSFAPAP